MKLDYRDKVDKKKLPLGQPRESGRAVPGATPLDREDAANDSGRGMDAVMLRDGNIRMDGYCREVAVSYTKNQGGGSGSDAATKRNEAGEEVN